MALNGSSSTITRASCSKQPREQHALHLAARQRADRALLEAGEADRCDRRLDRVALLAPDAAEQALGRATAPSPPCRRR